MKKKSRDRRIFNRRRSAAIKLYSKHPEQIEPMVRFFFDEEDEIQREIKRVTEITKAKQKIAISEIMQLDEESGLYINP